MDDKAKALETALSQIEKQFGKGAIMRLGADSDRPMEHVSSGSLSLDLALGVGGFPRGRIVEIYGPESSGKTTVALHAIAECQKTGGTAAFIDAEHALDPVYAKNLGVQVDDASADDVMAQLLVLESQDPNRDVMMYINSPGGSMTAMTAIYDTMQYIKPDVQTVCLGQAASAAAILLASGTKGKRLMLPNARVLIHQPAIDQGFGKATEIEIQAKEMLRMREWLEETLAKHTGQDVEKIRRDIEVDTFLTAPEAKEYGIVDEVLEHRQ